MDLSGFSSDEDILSGLEKSLPHNRKFTIHRL